MKRAFAFFLLSAIGILVSNTLSLSAQELPVDQETGKITYTEVVQLENSTASQEQLYSIAREWFATTFNSANNVLQMDDKELGKLIGKANFGIDMTAYQTDSHVDFTISVFVKEGRYKYTITDLEHVSNQSGYSGGALEDDKPDCGGMRMVKKGWVQVKEQTSEKVPLIIADLKATMAGSGNSEPDDDW